jgi:hypothetical protein
MVEQNGGNEWQWFVSPSELPFLIKAAELTALLSNGCLCENAITVTHAEF